MSSVSPSARPIILCGKTERVGATVTEAFKPEFEVIHFILTPEAAQTQIPLMLQGKTPPSDSSTGTHNYSSPPIAVVLGAWYDDEMIRSIRESCGADVKKLHWLRADTSIPTPPLGPEYGKAMVARAKEKMRELDEKGVDSGEIVYY